MIRSLFGAALVIALSTVVSGSAFAGGAPVPPLVVGEWVGKLSCNGLNNGSGIKIALTGTLDFSQASPTQVVGRLDVDGTAKNGLSLGLHEFVCGKITAPLSKPGRGRGALQRTGGDEHELLVDVALNSIRTFAANGKGETGKLAGVGTWAEGGVFLKCRWSFARVTLIDPELPTTVCS